MSKKLKDSRVADWGEYYASRGVEVDFSNIIIPKYDDKLWRPVLMPAHRELSLDKMLSLMRKNYDVKTYVPGDNLDLRVRWNARSNTLGSYVLIVRRELGYLAQSTEEADPYGMIGMNLRERLALGDKVYAETGKHLDRKGIVTLCTGSRCDGDGSVPGVYRGSGGTIWVSLSVCDFSAGHAGLREAVS